MAAPIHHAGSAPGPASSFPGLPPLVVRQATASDRAAIVELYEGLSPRSRYLRLFQATEHLTPPLRDLLTRLDGAMVWLAFDGDRCVGEARLVLADGGCAELAVTIDDAYQGRGLGDHLAGLAVASHPDPGGCISVATLPGNQGAVALARRHAVSFHLDGGLLEGTFRRDG
jgi:RimJ/RimL family protein N-acetyltransferase